MPKVTISNAALADLETLGYWFKTATPGETVECIVQNTMNRLGIEIDDETKQPVSAIIPDDKAGEVTLPLDDDVLFFDTSPNLTFSKPIKGTIDNKPVNNPNWTTLLHTMIAVIKALGLEGERLVQELGVTAKPFRFEDDSYRYIPELGISIQRQSAVDAWREIDRLAQKWTVPVEIKIIWRDNPRAEHPGKTGVLQSGLH